MDCKSAVLLTNSPERLVTTGELNGCSSPAISGDSHSCACKFPTVIVKAQTAIVSTSPHCLLIDILVLQPSASGLLFPWQCSYLKFAFTKWFRGRVAEIQCVVVFDGYPKATTSEYRASVLECQASRRGNWTCANADATYSILYASVDDSKDLAPSSFS